MRRQVSPLAIGVVSVVYVAAAKFGFTMAFAAEQVTLVWPPTGLALAMLLTFGTRVWPGIFLGAFIANATAHEPLAVAAVIAAGNTSEAVVGALLLRRYSGLSDSLDRLRQALALLVLGAGISTMVSATIGVTSLCAGGVQPWSAYGSLWWTWWLGDAAGDLLFAPVLLTWRAWGQIRRDGRLLEACVLFASLAATSALVFSGRLREGITHYPLEYTVFPFVMWAALRLGIGGTAVANLIASSIAVWGTVQGIGPYAAGGVTERLTLLQVFMGVVAGTGLLLGAAITEREAAARRRRAEHAVTKVLAHADTAAAATRGLLDTICEGLDWDVGLLWYVDRDAQCLRCADVLARGPVSVPIFERESRTRTFSPGIGLPGRVWELAQPQWIPDVVHDTNFPRLRAAASEGLHGAFAFPITLGNKVLGVVEFFSRSVRKPDADLLHMFAAIGAELGQFVDRKRIEQDVHESEARKAGMLEAALDCIVTIDHEGHIVEFNPAAERTFGYTREEAVGKDMADLIIPDAFRVHHRLGFARYLETGHSDLIGRRLEVTATRADGGEFPAELSIAKVPSAGRPMFTGFLRDITDRKRMVRQLAFRASHDALTKSLNRTAFMERLHAAGRARPSSGRSAVLFVDLDHFKAINDSLGHMAGDQLLIAVARRLRKCVRPGDAVARLGGDEFAVLLEAISEQEAAVVADRVRKTLADPFDLEGREVLLTASVGLALGSVGESRTDDLLREADAAMYREKASGTSNA